MCLKCFISLGSHGPSKKCHLGVWALPGVAVVHLVGAQFHHLQNAGGGGCAMGGVGGLNIAGLPVGGWFVGDGTAISPLARGDGRVVVVVGVGLVVLVPMH